MNFPLNSTAEAHRSQTTVAQLPDHRATRSFGLEITPKRLAPLASIILFVSLWESFSRSGLININLFPPPSNVAQEAYRMLQSGMMVADISISLRRATSGFLLGATIGIALGLLTGRIAIVRAALEPLIQLFRPIPSIAFVPLAILWFGLGETPKVFLITYAVFFPVWLNTHVGVSTVDMNLIRAAQCLGANRRQLFLEVILPASAPFVLAGLRQGTAVAFIVLVAAELTGATAGVGFRIATSHLIFRTDRMIVGLVLLGLLGASADRLFVALSHRLAFWAGNDQGDH